MKPIIVATDYSDTAETALQYAALIARFTHAQVALLNIYTFGIHALNGLISPAAMDDLADSNQKYLESYAKKLSLKYAIPLTAYSSVSSTETALKDLAKKLDAGLIVMGAKRNFEEHSLSGNISSAIINNTILPVLVVPQGISVTMPERFLYACDYHILPNDTHFSQLHEIVAAVGAEVQVFHISKETGADSEELKETVIDRLENSLGTLKRQYLYRGSKNIIEGLQEGIKDFKADILVMSPHKYGFWSSLFHKSKTREMALISTIPLLSLPS